MVPLFCMRNYCMSCIMLQSSGFQCSSESSKYIVNQIVDYFIGRHKKSQFYSTANTKSKYSTIHITVSLKSSISQKIKTYLDFDTFYFYLSVVSQLTHDFYYQANYITQSTLQSKLIQVQLVNQKFKFMINDHTHLSLRARLENAILQLESNQILQQMRNDESLAEYKRQHIRQILRQELQLQSLVEALSIQNTEMKTRATQAQQLLYLKQEEFVREIENIEVKWEQFRVQKQKEKKSMESQYQNEIKSVMQKYATVNQENLRLKSEFSKIAKEIEHLKSEKMRLQGQNSLAQQSILKLRRQIEAKDKEIHEKAKHLDSQSQFERTEYQEIIAKMQEDMHLIRQSWQRKCEEIETQLREENNLLALEYEEKMRKELREHAENLNLGNSVIITDSEEIIARRVERVQQEFVEQIKHIEQEMENLNKVCQNAKEDSEAKDKLIKELKNKQKEYELQIQRLQKQLALTAQSHNFEMERLRIERQRFQNQNKSLLEEIESVNKQRKQAKQQYTSILKRYNSLTLECQKYQQEINILTKKIANYASSQEQHQTQIIHQQQEIAKKEQIIVMKSSQNQRMNNQLQMIEQTLKMEKCHQEELAAHLRKQKDHGKKLIKVTDKLHLFIRRLRQEYEVLKEEVKCKFEMLKGKWSIECTQIIDHFTQNKEQSQRKYKLKMSELLDQMQIKEKELIDTLSQEKQQLKLQINDKDELLYKKEEENDKLRKKLTTFQQEKIIITQDLEKERLLTVRLQKKLQRSQEDYYNNISRVQKDVNKILSSFHSKWSQHLTQVQQQLDEKDAQVKLCVQKLEELSSQVEEQRKRKEWAEEQSRKCKRKYEQFKHERDNQVKGHLKRLQQETKHRLNLERELKQMRLTIMRGTTTNNGNNFSFNDRETNYNTNLKNYGSKEIDTNQREKQLSEIREMIAKTYKVVGETPIAERDIGRNPSKRNLF